MLIDSHCHLHDREFFTEEQAEAMLKRAHENGVDKIVCIGTNPEDSAAARDFATRHNGIYWTFGVHPEWAGRIAAEGDLKNVCFNEILGEEADRTRLVAIGEVGLDYHTEGYDKKAQLRLFEEMLQLAIKQDLPVVFHVRNAFDDFFPVVANFPGVRGVVHSFTDSKKTLRRILETTDFYIGVNGLATYSTLPTPPLERILLETDAPFLTPEPFRGIINEPGYVKEVARWLSEKLGTKFEFIERETTKNATRLYHFPDTERGEIQVAG